MLQRTNRRFNSGCTRRRECDPERQRSEDWNAESLRLVTRCVHHPGDVTTILDERDRFQERLKTHLIQ